MTGQALDYCGATTCAAFDALHSLLWTLLAAFGANAHDIAFAAPWFWPAVAAICGAVVASFSGLAVDRLPERLGWTIPEKGQPIRSLSHPPSHCDHCHARLSPIALIPIFGWIVNGGKCARCGTPVSPVYPIIEAGTAVVSCLIVVWFGPGGTAVASCLCLWMLLLISWLDWQEQEIPDFLTVPLFFIGAVCSPFDPDPLSRLAGGIIFGGMAWLAFRLTSSVRRIDAMAYGDVALATALGTWAGTCSTPILMFVSSVVYIAYSLPYRRRGTKWVPMGPALSIAFLITVLAGLRI